MFNALKSGESVHLFTRADHSHSDGGESITKSIR